MKINASSLRAMLPLVGVLALVPASLPAAPSQPSAYAFSVDAVHQSGDTLERGSTALKMLRLLGTPDRRISDNVWVYLNHRADLPQPGECGCDTLIVTLNRSQQIEEMKLVNPRAATLIAAGTRRNSTPRFASVE